MFLFYTGSTHQKQVPGNKKNSAHAILPEEDDLSNEVGLKKWRQPKKNIWTILEIEDNLKNEDDIQNLVIVWIAEGSWFTTQLGLDR